MAVCVLLTAALAAGGCSVEDSVVEKPGTDQVEKPGADQVEKPGAGQPAALLKGVSLSPRSYAAGDFTDFFERAGQAGDVLMWGGDWIELGSETGGSPVVAGLASRYDYIPLIEVSFFQQSTGELLRPMDSATRETYKNSAAAFAERYELKYLGLGVEINILYEKSPSDFEAFVGFFREVYDAVKLTSPDTVVFTVFQLERMKGLHGGLFGGTNDPANAQWSLLDKFPESDLIAFTTYPGLIYQDPSDIPGDYYTEIRSHTDKPIAFTEMGWHSDPSPVGWESSEAEQAEFVTRFFTLAEDIEAVLTIWSFLYDQDTFEPFRSMGLYRSDGTARAAWQEWLKAVDDLPRP